MFIWYLRITSGRFAPSQLVTYAPNARKARLQLLDDLKEIRSYYTEHPIVSEDIYERAEEFEARNLKAPLLDLSGPYASQLTVALRQKVSVQIYDYSWKEAESLEDAVKMGWLYKAPRTIWWSALDG